MDDVHSARQAAEKGRLEEWVHAYLSGPLRLPLVAVTRVCGPEPDLEYPQAPVRWEAKVAAMAAEISDPLALPPFITEYRDGTLSLRDGNHRHEALRRRGVTEFWAIVWCNSAADAEAAAMRPT